MSANKRMLTTSAFAVPDYSTTRMTQIIGNAEPQLGRKIDNDFLLMDSGDAVPPGLQIDIVLQGWEDLWRTKLKLMF